MGISEQFKAVRPLESGTSAASKFRWQRHPAWLTLKRDMQPMGQGQKHAVAQGPAQWVLWFLCFLLSIAEESSSHFVVVINLVTVPDVGLLIN